MPSSKREFTLILAYDRVNNSRRVFLKIHGLQDDVRSCLIIGPWNVNKIPCLSLVIEGVWVVHLTELTFKGLPIQCERPSLRFSCLLSLKPGSKTLVMDVFHRPFAFACTDFGILISLFINPAEPTHLIHVLLRYWWDVSLLLEEPILSISLNVKRLSWSPELSNLKLNSSDLNNVVLLNPVAVWTKTSDHHPQPVVSVLSGLKRSDLKIVSIFMKRE